MEWKNCSAGEGSTGLQSGVHYCSYRACTLRSGEAIANDYVVDGTLVDDRDYYSLS